MRTTICRAAMSLALLTLLAGCATRAPENGVNDPFEKINRGVYAFNDVADRFVLRPAAKGYEKVLPRPVRTGIGNFFDNLLLPISIANDVLQAKFVAAGRDTGRLLLNTTVGLGGLFDPATEIGLLAPDEDFDQTLGTWGVPEGPYLVIPILGPRTVRHVGGSLADALLNPLVQLRNDEIRWAGVILYAVDQRARLLPADEAVREAFDPYALVRDAYLQNRRYRVYDGEVPADEELFYEEDFEDFDEFEEDDSAD